MSQTLQDSAILRAKEVVRALCDYSEDETFLDTENAEVTFGAERDLDYSITSTIPFARESSRLEEYDDQKVIQKLSFFQNRDFSRKKSLSFSKCDSSGEFFFDSEKGKEMIQRDQEIMEKGLTLQNNDLNCTGCSSWIPMSSKKSSELQLLEDTLKGQLYTSIGEYMVAHSEPIGSLGDSPINQKIFFGRNTSTPTRRKSKVSDIGIGEGIFAISKLESSLDLESRDSCAIVPLSPMLLYSVKPKNTKSVCFDEFKYYIGSSCYKKIQRLRAEEMKLQAEKSEVDTTENATCLSKNLSKSLSSATIPLQERCSTNDNIIEEWIIEPRELVLDTSKGNRIKMINNSARNMKYKTKFDGRLINVSPLSGNLHAKSEIGLRIFAKRSVQKERQNIETIITVISGNREKTITVKILKEQKSKNITKDRSYKLY